MNPLLRLKVKVPLDYVHKIRNLNKEHGQKLLLENIKQRIIKLGNKNVLAVMQDPTDNSIFTVIGKKELNSKTNDDIIKITSQELVQNPPQTNNQFPVVSYNFLDSGLLPDEIATIRYALLHEENPRHLSGFASTFEPYFPLAASLLRAKAMLRECQAFKNRARLWELNKKAAARTGARIPVLSSNTTHILSNLTKNWNDVSKIWNKFKFANNPGWYKFDELIKNTHSLKKSIQQLFNELKQFGIKNNFPFEILKDEVKRVICMMIEEPYLLIEDSPGRPIKKLISEKLQNFPPEIKDLARKLIEEIGLGIWIVRADLLYKLFPPQLYDGYVSPSALQLSLAAGKPEISGVKYIGKVQKIYTNLNTEKNIDVLKAQAQMERANRAIERRRWINWYYKSSQL